MAEEVVKKVESPEEAKVLVQELPKKQKGGFRALLSVGAIALVAVAAFVTVNVLNSPARVKEQAMPSQQVFSDYNKAVMKISDHLLDDGETSGADDLEREVKKAEGFVKDAKQAKDQLETLAKNMSVGQLKDYKAALEKYSALASEFIQAEQESIDLYGAYVSPMKKYEDLSLEVAGASQYLYNNPSKYVTMLEDYKKNEEEIIGSFKAAKAPELYKDIHENFIKLMENETKFLDDMITAADDRDVDSIAAAQKSYSENSKKVTEDLERAGDAFDEKFEDKTDDLKDLEEEISDLYSALKTKYKF